MWAADLTLQWSANDPAEQVTEYVVYHSTDGTNFAVIGTTPDPTLEVSVQPGTHHFYVTAKNVWAESAPSNTVTTPAGVPSAPGSITITISIQVTQ